MKRYIRDNAFQSIQGYLSQQLGRLLKIKCCHERVDSPMHNELPTFSVEAGVKIQRIPMKERPS